MRKTATQAPLFTKSYFSIIKELKQSKNNNLHLMKDEPKKPLTKITEGIYSKYSANIETYIKKNKKNIQFRATTKYDNISIESFITELQSYKQTILNKIKDNPSLIPKLNQPVSEEEIILTPLPEQTQSQASLNGKLERNDFNSVKRTAVVMRIVEYTHRFKRDKMHPKQNIFGKHSRTKKLSNDDKAVFIVMKTAADKIEQWWMQVKQKLKHNTAITKVANDSAKVIHLQKWFRKQHKSSKILIQAIIQRPLIGKCISEKVKLSLFKVITIQKLIKRFLQQQHPPNSHGNEKDAFKKANEKEPISIIKIKPTLIYKEIRLKLNPTLYIDDNDIVSFRDMNEHSLNLQSFNISHNSSENKEEVIFDNKAESIEIVFKALKRICFNAFIKSLFLNNNINRVMKLERMRNRLTLNQYYNNWTNNARIDAYSFIIERTKSKTNSHSFVYKSKRFRNENKYTLYPTMQGLNAMLNLLYSKFIRKMKQKQMGIKCNLLSEALSKKYKADQCNIFLLRMKLITDGKISIGKDIQCNRNIKQSFAIDLINNNSKDQLKVSDYSAEESDDEIIDQINDNDDDDEVKVEVEVDSSTGTLTDEENDDKHPRIIPQEIKNIFYSKTKPKIDLNKSIDNITAQTNNANNRRFKGQQLYTQVKSKSVDKMRFVPNKTLTTPNMILIRDANSMNYEALI